MDITHALRQIFLYVDKEYQKYKKVYGLYDFTDLPQYLLDKLNDYGKILKVSMLYSLMSSKMLMIFN